MATKRSRRTVSVKPKRTPFAPRNKAAGKVRKVKIRF